MMAARHIELDHEFDIVEVCKKGERSSFPARAGRTDDVKVVRVKPLQAPLYTCPRRFPIVHVLPWRRSKLANFGDELVTRARVLRGKSSKCLAEHLLGGMVPGCYTVSSVYSINNEVFCPPVSKALMPALRAYLTVRNEMSDNKSSVSA